MPSTVTKYLCAVLVLLALPTVVSAYSQGYYEGYYQGYYQGNYILNNPAQNASLGINKAGWHYISTYNGSAQAFDGLMSDVYFIDGKQLTPSSFGAYDSNGYWKPAANYSGSLGTDGFHLDFANGAFADFSPSNGTVSVGPLYQTTNYRLICTAADTSALIETNTTVTVVGGANLNFKACDSVGQLCTTSSTTPIFVSSGQTPKLTWDAVGYDQNSCNVTSNNAGNTSTITGPTGTGTNFGGTTATGISGEALSFNGSSSYAEMFTTPSASVSTWSLSAWIKPATLSQLAMAVYNGNDTGGYGFGIGNGTGSAPGSKLQILFGGVAWLDPGYTFASANTWYHIVLTRDGSTTRVYVNGALLGTTFANTPATVSNLFTIGQQFNTNGIAARFFNGAIDDVRVYNRTLSAGEVSTLYSLSDVPTGLVLYWSLDASTISANNSITLQPMNTNTVTNAPAPAVTSQTTYTLTCLLGGSPVSTSLSVGVQQSCASGVGAAGSYCPSQCALMEDTPQIESTGTLAPSSATISWCCPSAPAAGTNFGTGGALSGTVSVAPGTNTTYSLSCPSGTASVNLQVIKPVPIVNSFSATRVRPGGQSTLSWTVARMAEDMSCSISPTPAGNQPSGSAGTWTGSTLTPPITRPTTFTLTCGSDEAGYVSTSATAGLLPTFKEK